MIRETSEVQVGEWVVFAEPNPGSRSRFFNLEKDKSYKIRGIKEEGTIQLEGAIQVIATRNNISPWFDIRQFSKEPEFLQRIRNATT